MLYLNVNLSILFSSLLYLIYSKKARFSLSAFQHFLSWFLFWTLSIVKLLKLFIVTFKFYSFRQLQATFNTAAILVSNFLKLFSSSHSNQFRTLSPVSAACYLQCSALSDNCSHLADNAPLQHTAVARPLRALVAKTLQSSPPRTAQLHSGVYNY